MDDADRINSNIHTELQLENIIIMKMDLCVKYYYSQNLWEVYETVHSTHIRSIRYVYREAPKCVLKNIIFSKKSLSQHLLISARDHSVMASS